MRTLVHRASVSARRPGPSAPTTTAQRGGVVIVKMSVASVTGVSAQISNPVAATSSNAVGPIVAADDRQVQQLAHRDAHAAPVERVGTRRVEQQRIDTQPAGRAGDRAEVLVIVDPLEHHDPPGSREHVGKRR